MDPAALDAVFRTPPALHRFPGAMAGRVQELCRAIADDYGNDASRVWTEATSGKDLEARLLGLPGIGSMKAKTLVAILTKRFGVRPPGWEAVVPTHPTLADVDSPESLAAYQAGKRAQEGRAQGAGRREEGVKPPRGRGARTVAVAAPGSSRYTRCRRNYLASLRNGASNHHGRPNQPCPQPRPRHRHHHHRTSERQAAPRSRSSSTTSTGGSTSAGCPARTASARGSSTSPPTRA